MAPPGKNPAYLVSYPTRGARDKCPIAGHAGSWAGEYLKNGGAVGEI
jgi:hypothetical protein